MYNLQTFISQNNNKYLDWDHQYGFQCVDLVNFWVAANGFPRLTGNANQLKQNVGERYDWIANTPSNIPQAGDIVVWNIGANGHTGIFVSGNVNTLTTFDQNFPLGSSCHLQPHSYNSCLGWLRMKNNVHTVTVVVPSLNVRQSPHVTSAVVGSLKQGNTVQVLQIVSGDSINGNTNWYQISNGYITAAYAR